MRLLVVDDDVNLTRIMTKFLVRQGYTVDVAMDGQDAWELLQTPIYDLVLLDIMMPKLDGVSLCQQLRQQGYSTPILLLTACSSSDDKVAGLDAGADDYVIKPFDWQELLARIRALLRREGTPTSPVLTWGLLQLNTNDCEVRYADREVSLRPKEYKLLELFLRNPNRVFSCGAILEHLWSFESLPSEDVVRAHVKGLRQTLRAAGATDVIETVYGLGYRLKPVELLAIAEAPPLTEPAISTDTANPLWEVIAATWEDVKPEILERVARLEQVIHSIYAGTTQPHFWQQAIVLAHNLAGTVGSYGFQQGSQLARQIEALLQSKHPLSQIQTTVLQEHIAALRHELSTRPQLAQLASSDHPSYRLESENPARILVINDDPSILKTLETMLEPWGLHPTPLQTTHQFWEQLENVAPDLLLLDVVTSQANGMELCERTRSTFRWAGLPVVFLTAHTDTETIQQLFMAGADDVINKSMIGPELATRLIRLINRHRSWQSLMERDRLTQLANRTKFIQDFSHLLQTAEQQQQSVCLAILNVDLRSINYQHGYTMGDAVLRYLGTMLNPTREAGTLAARWSGNKFAIALYGVDITKARQLLSGIITSFSTHQLTTPNGSHMTPGIRINFAQYPQDGQDAQTLCRVAEGFSPLPD